MEQMKQNCEDYKERVLNEFYDELKKRVRSMKRNSRQAGLKQYMNMKGR